MRATDDERDEIRRNLRKFLTEHSPSDEVRRLMETDAGFDPPLWRAMATELGLQGLALPEEYGGSGLSAVELAIAFEEAGRSLLCAPLLSTVVMAARTLLELGDDDACRDYLPRIADGSLVATLAGANHAPESGTAGFTARDAGGDVLVDGSDDYVLDGASAGLLLVAARTAAGSGVFAVDPAQPGVTRTPLPTVDTTRKLARVELHGARAHPVDGDAGAALAVVRDHALTALAAEQAGGAAWCLATSVAHACARVQFGRTIGSFQAVKHLCADMLLDVEAATAAAEHAASAAAEDPAELPLAAAIAKVVCSDAYFRTVRRTIQVHGGIGFTWEHDAQLHFKRAKSAQLFLGHPRTHRERVADLVGLAT